MRRRPDLGRPSCCCSFLQRRKDHSPLEARPRKKSTGEEISARSLVYRRVADVGRRAPPTRYRSFAGASSSARGVSSSRAASRWFGRGRGARRTRREDRRSSAASSPPRRVGAATTRGGALVLKERRPRARAASPTELRAAGRRRAPSTRAAVVARRPCASDREAGVSVRGDAAAVGSRDRADERGSLSLCDREPLSVRSAALHTRGGAPASRRDTRARNSP